MAVRPAFQWYPGDWRRDTALQSCSLEVRGFWVECLNLMHDGEPYGYLTANGAPIEPRELARMVGTTPARAKACLAELERKQVFSRTEDGVIFSRRMVRDEEVRAKRAAGGRLGGNPALMGGPKGPPEDNGKVGSKVNLPANLPPTPAVCSLQSALPRNAEATASGAASAASFPQLVPSGNSNGADLTDGELMGLVRQHFYAPDGKAPHGYNDGREFGIFALLRKHGKKGLEIADAIEGAAMIRDAGGRVGDVVVDWLHPGDKMTMRCLYNTRSGVTPFFELALQKLAESRKRTNGKRSSWEGKGALDAAAIKQALLA